MGKGLAGFAEGMMKGYFEGQRMKEAREERELRISRLRDEKAMNEEFKNLDKATKPAEGFILTAADGTKTVFADKKMAEEAKAAFGEGSQLEPKFIVAGQQYDTPEAAGDAADALNAPAARLRQRAEIALKYNRPDLADAYAKNYQNVLEANRRDMQEQFLQAQATGDFDSVLNTVNQRLRKNGAQASLVQGENGSLTYQVVKGGQIVSAKPFASAQEFWDTMGQQVSQTPDNMLETWRVRETLKQGAKGLELQGKKVDADIANDEARIRQGDKQLELQKEKNESDARLQKESIGVQRMSAANGAAQVGLGYAQLTQPKVHSGVDEAGNVTFGATQTPYDPKTKKFGLNVIGPQTATGMRPTPRGNQGSSLDSLLGGMAPAAPLVIDWSKVPQKNIGGTPAATTQTPR